MSTFVSFWTWNWDGNILWNGMTVWRSTWASRWIGMLFQKAEHVSFDSMCITAHIKDVLWKVSWLQTLKSSGCFVIFEEEFSFFEKLCKWISSSLSTSHQQVKLTWSINFKTVLKAIKSCVGDCLLFCVLSGWSSEQEPPSLQSNTLSGIMSSTDRKASMDRQMSVDRRLSMDRKASVSSNTESKSRKRSITGGKPRKRRSSRLSVKVTRPAYTEHEFQKGFHHQENHNFPFASRLRQAKCRLRLADLGKFLVKLVPIIHWLPRYSIKSNLIGDVVAGCTIGVMRIPQGKNRILLISFFFNYFSIQYIVYNDGNK